MNHILQDKELNDLLIKLVDAGNLGFIVKHEGNIKYLMINDILVRQGLGAFFMINGTFTPVSLNSIIMPGEPGRQRSIFIRDNKTGVNIIAKYVGFHDEKTDCNTEEVTFYFEVLIRGNEEDKQIVPLEDIQLQFPSRAECLEQEEIFARKKQVGCLRFPMTLPRGPENHVPYPGLDLLHIHVLFVLCKKYRITIGYNYPFNNLVIRFSACGPQTKFYDDIPELTESEQEDFKIFERKYSKELMGNVMVSNIQRSSKFSEQKVFRFQFAVYKSFKIHAIFALRLSRTFWIHNEIGVVLRKGDNDFVPHSSLKRLE